MRKKDWILCITVFCMLAALLVSANVWYMYAIEHVHLPEKIVLSEEVWREAFLDKVHICDEKKMTYFGFDTIITREFKQNDFKAAYHVKGSTFSSKKITRKIVATDPYNRYITLEEGAYLCNNSWNLQRRSGIFFPVYEYSTIVRYQKDYAYVEMMITCNDPEMPEFQALLADIIAYINTNTAQ